MTKWGRIAVYSDGGISPKSTRVVIVPDDGSEPIHLPVHSVKLTGDVTSPVVATIEARVTEVDVQSQDENVTVQVTAGLGKVALGPAVDIFTAYGKRVLARGFVWVHDLNHVPRPRLYVKGRIDD